MFSDVVPEDRLKYLDKDTYKIYEKMGDDLKDKNINQAFLCYENAEYLCDYEAEKERIIGKKNGLKESGNVAVNKAAFIILSYNNTYYLQRCIESIYTNCNPDAYLLVVFENGSKDGTSEWLAQWGNDHDEALVILNEENLGFSVGNNAACEYLPEGYDVFYLNNDTRVPANALFWMRMALYSSEEIGAVGAVQNYSEGDQLLDVRFDAPEQYMEFGASNNVPMDNPLEEQSKLCGFAMLVRREVYEKSGGFDPRFTPGYLEDDDLSLKIRDDGYKLVVCHNSYIYHVGSQSFIKRHDLRQLFEEHRKILISKWGFDATRFAVLSENELKYINELEKKGYKKDDHFSIVHIGCGCGNMLGRIHFMYPNADVYGVEENDDVRRFAISCIKVVRNVEELPMKLEEFDLVAQNLG